VRVDTLVHAADQANAELSRIIGRLRVLSEGISDSCRDTYRDTERGVRKLRVAAEEGIHDTRRQIKCHPLASIAVVASGAFLLGGLAAKLRNSHGRH